jgi:hypothetical protein
MARELNVTIAERTALGLTTIGAVDRTKPEREADAKERRSRRDRQRRQRIATNEGRILRARPGRPRKIGPQPYETLGMSRSAWYRAGKPRAGTDIRTTQGEVYGRCAFPSHSERAEPPGVRCGVNVPVREQELPVLSEPNLLARPGGNVPLALEQEPAPLSQPHAGRSSDDQVVTLVRHPDVATVMLWHSVYPFLERGPLGMIHEQEMTALIGSGLLVRNGEHVEITDLGHAIGSPATSTKLKAAA